MFYRIGPVKIKTADGIIGIYHIAWDKDLIRFIMEGYAPRRVSRYMEDIPYHPPYFQPFTAVELLLDLKSEIAILKIELSLAHVFEHLHSMHRPLVSIFQLNSLICMDPKLCPWHLFEDLRKTPDMIQVGMGHDDPFYILYIYSKVLYVRDLISPLHYQPGIS